MSTYSDKRDSGVDWFGSIPTQWGCEHLKRVAARIQTGTTPPTDKPDYYFDGTIPWFAPGSYDGGIVLHEPRKLINELALREGLLRIFPGGTVFLIGIGATIGKVGLIVKPASCNQQIIGIVSNHHMVGRYLAYQLKIYEDVIPNIAVTTTLPIFDQVKTGYLPVCSPPLPEQERIAAYLDASCAAIDAAVAAKREQLKTLDELRGTILLTALTEGIKSSGATQLTSSPVLPHIPNRWKLKRLKSVANIRYGLGQPPALLDSGVAMIRATDVDAGNISTNNLLRVDPQEIPQERNPYLKTGEIIVVRSGAYTGDSAIVPSELAGCVAGYDLVVTATRASPRFVAYCLLSRYVLEGQILLLTLRAAQSHLNAEQLGSVLLAFPPSRLEQDKIVDFLDNKLNEVKYLERGIECQIETLTSYRKSLIHECVTGQRRVTEADVARVRLSEKTGRLNLEPSKHIGQLKTPGVDDRQCAADSTDAGRRRRS